MKVFLTGAAGQLGSVLSEELRARGHEVTATGHKELDICDRDAILQAVSASAPDAVVNCAAYNKVDQAETDADNCMLCNTKATACLAEAAALTGAKFMTFSTDYIFDGRQTEPYDEEAEAAPLNVYGRSKAESETAVREILDRHFIVRVSWLYNNNGSNFVNTMLRLGKTKSELRVVADQIGSPTYAPRLAKPLADMLESDKYGTYNLTSEGFVTWYDFAKAIFEHADMPVKVIPVTSSEYKTAALRPKSSRLSKKKACKAGFGPIGTWQEHLDDFFENYSENQFF